MIHQKTLYLCSMPKGENEDLLLFVVPKVHWVATLNGFHRDAGHQGHDHTLSLLQEYFWRPEMTSRCGNPSEPAHAVYSMRAACPRPLYTPSWLLLPQISYMLTSPAKRPLWSQTSHLELLISWCSKTTSQSTYWHM